MLPADAPAWQRHFHGDGYGYGWLLGLILVALAFQMAAPETDWARVVTIMLQGFTLIAALTVSGVRRWLIHVATVVTALAIVDRDRDPDRLGRARSRRRRASLGLLLVALAPAAILRRHRPPGARAPGRSRCGRCSASSASTCCIGTAFAFAYGIISAIDDGGFFAQIAGGDQSDFLYFSFATMTTTGLRRPDRGRRPRPLAGDHRGAVRADLPGHRWSP